MLALKGKRVQDSREVFLRRELGCELGRDRRIESTIKTIQGIQGGSRQRTRKRKQRTVLKIKFYEEQEQQKLVTTISTEQNEAEPMESELMSLADKFDRMIDDDSVLQLSDEYCCSSTTS